MKRCISIAASIAVCLSASDGSATHEATREASHEANHQLTRASTHANITASQNWMSLARKVGESEVGRVGAIRSLRRMPYLSAKLRSALTSESERPFALEVISDLHLENFLPELLDRMSSDSDGFTVLAVNGLMTESNSANILAREIEILEPKATDHLPPAPIVTAALEPLARAGCVLSRKALERLSQSSSADTRSALLSYLRILVLRHDKTSDLDLIRHHLHASEPQVRLQAISLMGEVVERHPELEQKSGLESRQILTSLCLEERNADDKEGCLAFLARSLAERP